MISLRLFSLFLDIRNIQKEEEMIRRKRRKDITFQKVFLKDNHNNDHHTLQSSVPPFGKKITASAWKVVAILSSVATMVMYAETMLVPAIPDLIKDFNIPYSTSSWILTTYLITGAVMTPIAGKL